MKYNCAMCSQVCMALFTGTTTQTLAMLLFLHCSQNWSALTAVAQNSSSVVINLTTGTVYKVSEFGTRDARRGLSWEGSISDFFFKNDIYSIFFNFEATRTDQFSLTRMSTLAVFTEDYRHSP